MRMKDNYKRTLKGVLLNYAMDFKKTFSISILIIIGIFLTTFVIFTLSATLFDSQFSSRSNSSILSSGFITIVISFSISIFATMSNSEIGRKFVFPINRKVFAIGTFIFIILGSIAMLLTLSIMEIFELLIAVIFESIFDNFIFLNYITLNNFIAGFWVSLCYLIFIMSFVYFLAMYFYRYKKTTILAISLIIALFIGLGEARELFLSCFTFIFTEPSLMILSIKLWALTLLFHLLGYIPLRRMEVIK